MIWRLHGDRQLDFGSRVQIIGVLNVTPDSFYDGGRHVDPQRAADHAMRLADEGADIIERLGNKADSSTKARYRESEQIVLGWIKRYTKFDFRSLGSYTRDELHRQGTSPDAF